MALLNYSELNYLRRTSVKKWNKMQIYFSVSPNNSALYIKEYLFLLCLQVREAAYKLYLYPDPHQMGLLQALLEHRFELAQLVGFPTYGHRTLRGTLAQDPGVLIHIEQSHYNISISSKLHPLDFP